MQCDSGGWSALSAAVEQRIGSRARRTRGPPSGPMSSPASSHSGSPADPGGDTEASLLLPPLRSKPWGDVTSGMRGRLKRTALVAAAVAPSAPSSALRGVWVSGMGELKTLLAAAPGAALGDSHVPRDMPTEPLWPDCCCGCCCWCSLVTGSSLSCSSPRMPSEMSDNIDIPSSDAAA